MKCNPRRMNDQMQCHCGLAWDIDEEKPSCAGEEFSPPKEPCQYCDGTGFFYSEPELGECCCKSPMVHVDLASGKDYTVKAVFENGVFKS